MCQYGLEPFAKRTSREAIKRNNLRHVSEPLMKITFMANESESRRGSEWLNLGFSGSVTCLSHLLPRCGSDVIAARIFASGSKTYPTFSELPAR